MKKIFIVFSLLLLCIVLAILSTLTTQANTPSAYAPEPVAVALAPADSGAARIDSISLYQGRNPVAYYILYCGATLALTAIVVFRHNTIEKRRERFEGTIWKARVRFPRLCIHQAPA